jgi:hypothetical protein
VLGTQAAAMRVLMVSRKDYLRCSRGLSFRDRQKRRSSDVICTECADSISSCYFYHGVAVADFGYWEMSLYAYYPNTF